MSRLPRSVEKQAELADQMHKNAYGTPQSTPEAPVTPSNSAPAEPLAEIVADAPKTEPVTPEQPQTVDQSLEEGDLSHWRHRAKVAEGRLSKEMPRMAQTIRELKDQISSAQAKVIESNNTQAQPIDSVIKPEEVEQYGADFIDMVKRVARSVDSVDTNLVQKVNAVAEEQRSNTREKFFEKLAADAPQWESLNSDEGFLAHLDGLDPYTGRQRKDIFDDAYEKLDAWRVANFFNAYSEPRQNKKDDLPIPSFADQVVPSGSRSGAPPEGKRSWTKQQVARFYDEVRRGVHTEEEGNLIEADIFAARSEGRLR